MSNQEQPAMASHFFRTGHTWLAYGVTGLFAFFVNVLGPMMPFLRAELNLSYTLASLHFAASALGRVLTGLSGDRLIVRFGRRPVLWVSAAGMSLSALLLLAGRHPALTIGATFAMGLCGALIPVIAQAVLADVHGRMRGVAFTESNAVASACATLAPLLLSFTARSSLGWRAGIAIVALSLAPLYLVFRRYTLPASLQARGGKGRAAGRLPRAFWGYWVLMVLVVAVEFGIIYWAADFLVQSHGLAQADAALSLSLFVGSMLASRLFGSWLLRRYQSSALLIGLLGLALAGFVLHWLGPSFWLSGAGLLLAGFGVANLYPLALTFGMNTAAGLIDRASAQSALAVSVATLTLPLLLGWLADLMGIKLAYGTVALLLGIALAVAPLARRLERST